MVQLLWKTVSPFRTKKGQPYLGGSHNATFGSIPEGIKNRFEELSAYPFCLFLFFIYVSLCIFPQRPEEGVEFGAGVTSGCVWVSVCVFTIEYYSALKMEGIPTHAVT